MARSSSLVSTFDNRFREYRWANTSLGLTRWVHHKCIIRQLHSNVRNGE